MSESLLVFDVWPGTIASARIPFNNNVRRMEVLVGPVISASTSAQPSSPSERDIYIIPSGATGSNWASFNEDDIVIFYENTWTAFAPFDGLRKFVEDEGEDWQYIGDSSGGWSPAGGGGGGIPDAPSDGTLYGRKDAAWEAVPPSVPAPVVAEAGTSLLADGTNAGNYTRFTSASAKTYSFDDGETYAIDAEYHGRNVGAGDLTLTEVGSFSINPPAGGTLVIPQGGTFTVKIVASAEADLFGVTVAL